MSARDLHVLGINAYDHDVSACLLRNGELVCAINKERLTRVKHDSGFHREVVEYCLDAGGIDLERLDLAVTNSYVLPVPDFEHRLRAFHSAYHLHLRERADALRSPLFAGAPPRWRTVSHHLAHAYSAFAPSPFEEGAVMIVDGVGGYRSDVTEAIPPGDDTPLQARESESYYRFRGSEIECLRKVWLQPTRGFVNDEFHSMDGLGALYSRASIYIFRDWNKCGEVMGLAPYGGPNLQRLVELRDGELYFHPWGDELMRPFLGRSDKVWEQSPHRDHWADLAWRIQDDTEQVLLQRAQWLWERTQTDNLCIAGGVGLNCVANGRILREGPFKNVFIQPAAGDDGTALGCALYGHLALQERKRVYVMKTAYTGRSYDDPYVRAALKGATVRVAAAHKKSEHVARETAALLARGQIVGWLQGGSEYGPRALGNRSILADPRDPKMKDRVNAHVKHRQGFRPFAPAVPLERVSEFFLGDEESPFMILASQVRPEMRDRLGAVVHVDGSARVQTVRREDNPAFHALLEAFGELTGVPVLLNTSFNVRGEPIVETPLDAVDTFLMTDLDVLVLNDWIVRKRALPRFLNPLLRFAVTFRRNLHADALMEHAAHSVLDSEE
ncbi:MAG: carbamoyltransferase [Planctomycetota bacterium]|nr:carbamoyltransferase [Planctomycetota bacterium]